MRFFAKSAQNTRSREKWALLPHWKPPLLSAFCFGFLFSNSLVAQPGTDPSRAERLLNAVLVNVQTLRNIEAGVRMDVYVMGKEYTVRGKYEEQRLSNPPPGDFQRSMYRLDLNFVLDAPMDPNTEPNRLTMICHPLPDRESGRFWQYTSIEGEKTLKYISLAKLEDAVRQKGKQATIGSVGDVKNLGGLSGTLKQISQFYEFTESPKETVSDSRSVWKVVGSLRPEYRESMIKSFGGLERKTSNYPRQMPTDIEIDIGRDDAFPYRIEYQNRPQDYSPKITVLTRIVYFDVSLNDEPIPEFKFSAFDKGDLPKGVFRHEDDTVRMIRSLGL